jgi:histidyl-tRNA synthetase
MQKAALPAGTRDFSPKVLKNRKKIIQTIENCYMLHGFQAIETPAMELLTTLTGKYGEEGDQLLFKILNSRLHEHKDKAMLQAQFEQSLHQALNSEALTERALRYDLTIPFARYVAMNRNDIVLPFKRYQIQPVWRADRPQKGRYREFYQCDADIIGSDSLMNEVELLQVVKSVLSQLGVGFEVKLNNRKILQGICELLEVADKFIAITVAIDKWDKVGKEGVAIALAKCEIDATTIEKLIALIDTNDSNEACLHNLKAQSNGNEMLLKGIEEMQFIIDVLGDKILELKLDFTLARGLNYYTGCIIEVVAMDVKIGSIVGGGRYDNLTGNFGWQGVSGVGVSFGIDRIYDVMLELNLFDNQVAAPVDVLLIHNEINTKMILGIQEMLISNNVKSMIYPDIKKMEKQLDYANKTKIPFVIIVNEKELNTNKIVLKNMQTGTQQEVGLDALIQKIKV